MSERKKMDIALLLGIILIGVFTGMVTGLTGASGVMVVVPLASMLLGFSIHEAIGTSMLVNVISSLAISIIYFIYGNVHIKLALWIALGSIVGAQLGTFFAGEIPELGLSGTFSVFMVIMGAIIWKRGLNRESMAKIAEKAVKFKSEAQRNIVCLILGFAIGIMTGILGAGGGGMILLILIVVLGFPIHLAIGTSSLLMMITTCSGTIGYAMQGNIRLLPSVILGISAACSGVLSAVFANRVNEQILSKVVGAVFILLGVVMTGFYFL